VWQACVVAWQFWNAGSQDPTAGASKIGGAFKAVGGCGGNAEVDHRVPLFRVWSEYRHALAD
jgi:hypothetical protein